MLFRSSEHAKLILTISNAKSSRDLFFAQLARLLKDTGHMIRYRPQDIPAQIPDTDVQLILQANDMRWEDIDEDAAKSLEARAILHDISVSKYRRAEYSAGMY